MILERLPNGTDIESHYPLSQLPGVPSRHKRDLWVAVKELLKSGVSFVKAILGIAPTSSSDHYLMTGTSDVETVRDGVVQIQKEMVRVTKEQGQVLLKMQGAQMAMNNDLVKLRNFLQAELKEVNDVPMYHTLHLAQAKIADDHLLFLLSDVIVKLEIDAALYRRTARVMDFSMRCGSQKVAIDIVVTGRQEAAQPHLVDGQVCGLPLDNVVDHGSCVKYDPTKPGYVISSNGYVCTWTKGVWILHPVDGSYVELDDGCYADLGLFRYTFNGTLLNTIVSSTITFGNYTELPRVGLGNLTFGEIPEFHEVEIRGVRSFWLSVIAMTCVGVFVVSAIVTSCFLLYRYKTMQLKKRFDLESQTDEHKEEEMKPIITGVPEFWRKNIEERLKRLELARGIKSPPAIPVESYESEDSS